MKKIKLKFPKVSIIAINWNNLEDTIEFLQSTRVLDYPNYETIVLDNASTIGDPDKIKEFFPSVQVIKNDKNMGWGGGVNVAIRHAFENETEYVWLLNNDATVEVDTLSNLVNVAQENPKIGLVSPIMYYYSMPDKIENCGAVFLWKNYTTRHIEKPEDIGNYEQSDIWLWGTAVLIKRSVFEAIGYFNEKYFIYNDDLEYSYRASKSGFLNKVATSAKIYHKSHFSGSERVLPPYYFYYMTRNTFFFWIENTAWYRRLSFIRTYLYQIFCGILENQKKSNDAVVDAYLDGLYAAFRNKGGEWDKSYKMPGIVKRAIRRYPNFWCDLAGLRFGEIIIACFKRLGNMFSK